MKKQFFYSAFIIIFGISSSCNKNDVIDPKLTLENLNTNNVRDELVEIYASARFGKTKGNILRIEPIARDKDTLAYIINYGDGWELLAGDDRYTPILAKGEGEYNVEKLNPGQRVWLDSELERVKAVKHGDLLIDGHMMQKNQSFWKKLKGPQINTKAEGDPIEDNQYWELVEIIDYDYEEETTGHLVDTQWGQYSPWNAYIPHVNGNSGDRCAAGCVSVAGAQLLRFLHYDIGKPAMCYTSGTAIGDRFGYSIDLFDPSPTAWSDMALHRLDIFKSTDLSALMVAWVAYDVIHDLVHFGEDMTSGGIYKMKNMLEDLGISYIEDDYDNMRNQISYYLVNKRQPCLVSATTTMIPIPNSGHCWLIDGYLTEIFYKKYIYRWTSRTDNHLYEYDERKEEIEEVTHNYILMNWGYDGSGDNTRYAASVYGDWQYKSDDYEYNRSVIYDFN